MQLQRIKCTFHSTHKINAFVLAVNIKISIAVFSVCINSFPYGIWRACFHSRLQSQGRQYDSDSCVMLFIAPFGETVLQHHLPTLRCGGLEHSSCELSYVRCHVSVCNAEWIT